MFHRRTYYVSEDPFLSTWITALIFGGTTVILIGTFSFITWILLYWNAAMVPPKWIGAVLLSGMALLFLGVIPLFVGILIGLIIEAIPSTKSPQQ